MEEGAVIEISSIPWVWVAVTISGRVGDDAKPYQIKLVKEKIEETQK